MVEAAEIRACSTRARWWWPAAAAACRSRASAATSWGSTRSSTRTSRRRWSGRLVGADLAAAADRRRAGRCSTSARRDERAGRRDDGRRGARPPGRRPVPAGQHGAQDRGGRRSSSRAAAGRPSSPRSRPRPTPLAGPHRHARSSREPRPRSVLTWRPPPAAEVPAGLGARPGPAGGPAGLRQLHDLPRRLPHPRAGTRPTSTATAPSPSTAREWADLGWMANHIGPVAAGARGDARGGGRGARRPYSPDLDEPLRDLMAEALLGRARDDGFDVIGTEGAQAGVGYAALACLDPGDEAIVTDPGYFHFVPALRLAGGVPVWVRLSAGERLAARPRRGRAPPSRRARRWWWSAIPVNPFGTVQTRDELEALLRLSAERGIVLLADTTHSAHRVDPAARAPPDRRRRRGPPRRDGARVQRPRPRLRDGRRAHRRARRRPGAGAGVPAGEDRGRAAQHQPRGPGRRGGGAARRGLGPPRARTSSGATSRRCTAVAPPVVDPAYGFSCVVDVSGTGGERPGAHRGPLPAPGGGLPRRRAGRGRRHHHDPPQPERPRPVGAGAVRRGVPRGGRGGAHPAPTATPSATSSCRTAPPAAAASRPWWRAGRDVPSRRASPGRAAAGRRRVPPARSTRSPRGRRRRAPRPRRASETSTALGWMPVTSSTSTRRSSPGAGGGVSSKTSRRTSPVSASRLSMVTVQARADHRAPGPRRGTAR